MPNKGIFSILNISGIFSITMNDSLSPRGIPHLNIAVTLETRAISKNFPFNCTKTSHEYWNCNFKEIFFIGKVSNGELFVVSI